MVWTLQTCMPIGHRQKQEIEAASGFNERCGLLQWHIWVAPAILPMFRASLRMQAEVDPLQVVRPQQLFEGVFFKALDASILAASLYLDENVPFSPR
jgi:hypothetical protein